MQGIKQLYPGRFGLADRMCPKKWWMSRMNEWSLVNGRDQIQAYRV